MRAAALLLACAAVAAGAPAFNILPAGKPTTARGLQLFQQPSKPSGTASVIPDSSSEDESSSTGGGDGSSGDGEGDGALSGASGGDDATPLEATDDEAGSASVQESVPSPDTPAVETTSPPEPSPLDIDVTDVASSPPQSAEGGAASADVNSVSGSGATVTDDAAVATRTVAFAGGQQFSTGDAATASGTLSQSGIISALGGIQTQARFGGVTVNEGRLKGSFFSQGGNSLLPSLPQALPGLGNPHKHLEFVTQLTSGVVPSKVDENKVERVDTEPKAEERKRKRGRGQGRRGRSQPKRENSTQKPEPTVKPETTGEKDLGKV